jgi:hypothetical protein
MATFSRRDLVRWFGSVAAPLAETTVASAVRSRGGGGAQVNKIATWLQQMKLGDVAKLAAEGNNPEAVQAIKTVKDASRLAQK